MADENNDSSPASLNPTCTECGQPTNLLTFIPRFGDRPAYRAFECVACNSLEWVAEKMGGAIKD
jgi:hypothetical protein